MPTFSPRIYRIDQEIPSSHQVVPKTAAYQMVPRDTLVKVVPTASSFGVTLPSVALCAGGLYVIKQLSGSNRVTIVDKGDVNYPVSIPLIIPTGAVVLYSDGEQWYTIFHAAM